MYFALTDKYGNIIKSDSESKVSVGIVSSGDKFASTLEGQTSFIASQGVFVVKDIIYTGSPDSIQSISITTTGIDSSIPSNNPSQNASLS